MGWVEGEKSPKEDAREKGGSQGGGLQQEQNLGLCWGQDAPSGVRLSSSRTTCTWMSILMLVQWVS